MVCSSLATAHAAVVALVHDFAAQEAHYLSPGYSEAQARLSFIDKFWTALGWDVNHEHQKNPYAQEVKVENPQKIGGSSHRADYAFHTAPNFRDARFFCEAKKPAVQLRTDADAAFQTIRYGYSAGTPLAVLTDFEQLHILDCRAKPHIDTALARSHRYFHYKDWLDPEKFAQLYYLFSREAFATGTHDAYVRQLPKPKKTGQRPGPLRSGQERVGLDFLTDLEAYRETLAKLLKAADHTLDGDALTELVQRILDRLVFLRFLEDKLIETEIQVSHFSRAAGGQSWAKFIAASGKLNDRYNGVVFKKHPLLDDPTRLPVDPARFADLCEDLSHVRSGYNFNYIPIHILGSIYERFLGKIIVTTGQRARVEEKPEVRKAGGVYYTPEYIVRYICQQTVGQLIEGKSPAQIAKMRFADIACGSGSFLLGLYDLLLRTHEQWYTANPQAAVAENLAPPDKARRRKTEFIPAVVERDGLLRLTLEKKRDILLNNVFGVDLDPQAVEVAQLSLYLKLLEDETTATARQHYLDFHEALLPSLSKNVVRGNSLIGTDILFGQFEFSAQEERKLAPMDFASAFPHIFPPRWNGESTRVAETPFGDFIEVGPGEPTRDLLHYAEKSGEPQSKPAPKRKAEPEDNSNGFDAIVGNPPYLGGREWTEPLRQVRPYFESRYPSMVDQYDLYALFLERAVELVKTGGAVGYITPNTWLNSEHFLKLRETMLAKTQIRTLADLRDIKVFEDATVLPIIFVANVCQKPTGNDFITITRFTSPDTSESFQSTANAWSIFPGSVFNLSLSIKDVSAIKQIELASVPLSQLADCRFGVKVYQKGKGKPPQTGAEAEEQRYESEENRSHEWHPYIWGKHLSRWHVSDTDTWLHYGPHLAEPRTFDLFTGPRVLVRRIVGERLIVAPVTATVIADQLIHTVKPRQTKLSAVFIAGVLGSKATAYYFRKRYNRTEKTFPEIRVAELNSLRIPLIAPAQQAQHDRMVQLVEAMLSTQQQLATAANENDRTYYESKVANLDRQIDELTCDLYGLTLAERALVAGS